MLTTKYRLNVVEHSFPVQASAEISPSSGSVLVINFEKLDGCKLNSAVLLPIDANLSFWYEPDMALYPIFSENAEVEIEFGVHVNTVIKKHSLLAFITTRSTTGEVMTRIHGL